MTFEDWLIKEGHVRDHDTIINDCSAGELEALYELYLEDYPEKK